MRKCILTLGIVSLMLFAGCGGFELVGWKNNNELIDSVKIIKIDTVKVEIEIKTGFILDTLMVQRSNIALDPIDWKTAKEKCDSLNNLKDCGDGWRLPNIAELKDLRKYSIALLIPRDRNYWSSDTTDDGYPYYMYMSPSSSSKYDSIAYDNTGTKKCYCRAVRTVKE